MGAGPTISIITVVRNAAASLATTIASVRAQTYENIEYVVVDGASTDGTADVLRNSSSRIDRWISEPDNGLYDAMNKGKSMAGGDFAMFVNAGDRFVDNAAISSMVGQIRDLDTLYFGRVRITDCTGRLSWEVPVLGKNGRPPQSYFPHHQSIFYPRRFFSRADYDPAMGYRADAHYTGRACQELAREFANVMLIECTLGGISSRAITSFAELRGEIALETAFARHVAASTGNHLQLIDVTAGAVLKYVASKIGGPPLVHRLMYTKHVLRSWVTSIRGS